MARRRVVGGREVFVALVEGTEGERSESAVVLSVNGGPYLRADLSTYHPDPDVADAMDSIRGGGVSRAVVES